MTRDIKKLGGTEERGPGERGSELPRCGAKRVLTACAGKEKALGLHLLLSRRRPRLGASPHSAGVHSHALSAHAPSVRAFPAHAFALLLICAFAFAAALPGHAQAPAPASAGPVISGPPDVLVIVSQQPGGADAVDITYAGKVPHAQAAQDSAALVKAGGWLTGKTAVADAAGPLKNRPSVMTDVIFQAIGVVPKGTGTLPVEPFVSAFHAYKRLNVVFFTTPQFQFQGAKSYADTDIRMAMDQHGTTYTYQIQILNPSLGPVPALETGAQAGAAHPSPWLLLGGILGAAALAGLIVYLLTARLTAKAPPAHTHDDEAQAEGPQEVAAKR